jgi:membrane-bound lytic murein transglycosylase B
MFTRGRFKGVKIVKKSRVVIAGLAFTLISLGAPYFSQASVKEATSNNTKNQVSPKASVKAISNACLKAALKPAPKPQYPPKPRPRSRIC